MNRATLFATAFAAGLALPTFALAASACDSSLAAAKQSYIALSDDTPSDTLDNLAEQFTEAEELAESDPAGCMKLVGQLQRVMSKKGEVPAMAMKGAPTAPQAGSMTASAPGSAASTGSRSASASSSAPANSPNTKAAADYTAALAKSDAAVDTLATVGKATPEATEAFKITSQEAGNSAAELRATFEQIDVATLTKGISEQLFTNLKDAQADFVSSTVARDAAYELVKDSLNTSTRDTAAVQQAWKDAEAADAAHDRASAVLDLAQARAEGKVDTDDYDDMYPGYAEAFRRMKIRHMREIKTVDLQCNNIFAAVNFKMLNAFMKGRGDHFAAGQEADKKCAAVYKPVEDRHEAEREALRLKYLRKDDDEDLAPMDDLYGPDKKPKPKPKPKPPEDDLLAPLTPSKKPNAEPKPAPDELLAPLTPSKSPKTKAPAKRPAAPPKKP